VKRTLAALWAALSSRALAPLVIGFFFALYIGIAFFTDETLTVLIALTSRNRFLAAVLGLLPLNFACRIVVEATGYLKRRRALSRVAVALDPALYDETVELAASPDFAGLPERLSAAGYRTRRSGEFLAAWRGISLSPARLVFLATACCLFAGILVSLVGRTVTRQPVIEGELFPSPTGNGGLVQRIVFQKAFGYFLAKDLTMEVAGSGPGDSTKELGVYPPNLVGGAFVYPRYLGVALNCKFTAPDLPGGFEHSDIFAIYPPGKEAQLLVKDSPYKITLSLDKPQDGSDPYMTGQLVLHFKLVKGSDLLLEGNVPKGGEFAKDGFRLVIPEARRMVLTDFVVDYGVLLIWGAGLLLLVAVFVWLPVRLFFPRREMLFQGGGGTVRACSHAEGRAREHAGVFHEVLDVLAGKQPDSSVS
jgi:hypothetical protein